MNSELRERFSNPVRLDKSLFGNATLYQFYSDASSIPPDIQLMTKEEREEEQKWNHLDRDAPPTFERQLQLRESMAGFRLKAAHERRKEEAYASVISSAIRKPDQVIQPWMFGHEETKATCLWLKNLPALTPSNIVEGLRHSVHLEPPGPERWLNRSRTFTGIAQAMAEQWGAGGTNPAPKNE